ncbi:uncharacterized protein LOC128551140 [Mercenaria mercenaria]|uniref:uncharacterized protein LOC128551140 n=1 Tax=Mercenaria mercenaria TaxID=6596 RepID=UPI00234F5F59|nr:uncharacterized protein LOC128551140 [Mercenaria mercenaria]
MKMEGFGQLLKGVVSTAEGVYNTFSSGYQNHVANASPYKIWAKVDTSPTGSAPLNTGEGYSPIEPNKFICFKPDQKSTTVYISIQIEKDGKREQLADRLPKRRDANVMVTQDGRVAGTVYGNIWAEQK